MNAPYTVAARGKGFCVVGPIIPTGYPMGVVWMPEAEANTMAALLNNVDLHAEKRTQKAMRTALGISE